MSFRFFMMRLFQGFLTTFIVFFCNITLGQNNGVILIQDSLITKAFDLKIKANKEVYDQYEFRIQLYYGVYEKAKKIMESVRNLDPNLKPNLSFETPNYKVQVGPFKKRAEAVSQLRRLKNHYKEAFLLEPKVQ